MKRLRLQRFGLPSADLDHATLVTQLKWPFNIGGCTKFHFGNDQVASHMRLAAPKSGCSQQALFTTVLPIILLQLNKISYIDYLMTYIYIIIACCGELVSYLNTVTPYS